MTKAYISDTELVDLYDAASDKEKLIDSVAVRCHTTRAVIRERLVQLGCSEEPAVSASSAKGSKSPALKSKSAKFDRKPAAPLDELRAMELFKDGLDDLGMAETLGVSVQRVKAWRSRMHLKRPRGAAAHKKKPKEEADVKSKIVPETTISIPPPSPGPAPELEEQLTLAVFKQLLNTFLPSTLGEAKLYIDGRPILGVLGYHVTMPDGKLAVDLETEETRA